MVFSKQEWFIITSIVGFITGAVIQIGYAFTYDFSVFTPLIFTDHAFSGFSVLTVVLLIQACLECYLRKTGKLVIWDDFKVIFDTTKK